MSELKAIWVDIDLTKLGKDAKHLFRTSEKNGHKYVTLTLSPRKEAPLWNEHEIYSLAAYDKEGGEGEKNIYVGSGQVAIWDREKKEEKEELKSIKEQADEDDDDLPF